MTSFVKALASSACSLLLKLADTLRQASNVGEEISIPEPLDRELGDLMQKTTFPADATQELVQVLDNGEHSLWSRMGTGAFVTVFAVLRMSNSSWPQSRGLCLLTEYLQGINHTASTSTSNGEIIALTTRKSQVGIKLLPIMLSNFVNGGAHERVRRWMGLLVLELLKDSEHNVQSLKQCPEDKRQFRRSIGTIIVHERSALLKLIAGSIIREGIDNGLPEELFWPEGTGSEWLTSFPESRHLTSQWAELFEEYLDNMPTQTWMKNSSFVLFAKGCVLGGEAHTINQDSAIIVTIYRYLSIWIPASPRRPSQYVDIPIENILEIDMNTWTSPTRSSAAAKTEETTLTVCLTHPEGCTFYINALGQNSSTIDIVFDSAEVAADLRSKAFELRSSMSQNPRVSSSRPLDASDRGIEFQDGGRSYESLDTPGMENGNELMVTAAQASELMPDDSTYNALDTNNSTPNVDTSIRDGPAPLAFSRIATVTTAISAAVDHPGEPQANGGLGHIEEVASVAPKIVANPHVKAFEKEASILTQWQPSQASLRPVAEPAKPRSAFENKSSDGVVSGLFVIEPPLNYRTSLGTASVAARTDRSIKDSINPSSPVRSGSGFLRNQKLNNNIPRSDNTGRKDQRLQKKLSGRLRDRTGARPNPLPLDLESSRGGNVRAHRKSLQSNGTKTGHTLKNPPASSTHGLPSTYQPLVRKGDAKSGEGEKKLNDDDDLFVLRDSSPEASNALPEQPISSREARRSSKRIDPASVPSVRNSAWPTTVKELSKKKQVKDQRKPFTTVISSRPDDFVDDNNKQDGSPTYVKGQAPKSTFRPLSNEKKASVHEDVHSTNRQEPEGAGVLDKNDHEMTGRIQAPNKKRKSAPAVLKQPRKRRAAALVATKKIQGLPVDDLPATASEMPKDSKAENKELSLTNPERLEGLHVDKQNLEAKKRNGRKPRVSDPSPLKYKNVMVFNEHDHRAGNPSLAQKEAGYSPGLNDFTGTSDGVNLVNAEPFPAPEAIMGNHETNATSPGLIYDPTANQFQDIKAGGELTDILDHETPYFDDAFGYGDYNANSVENSAQRGRVTVSPTLTDHRASELPINKDLRFKKSPRKDRPGRVGATAGPASTHISNSNADGQAAKETSETNRHKVTKLRQALSILNSNEQKPSQMLKSANQSVREKGRLAPNPMRKEQIRENPGSKNRSATLATALHSQKHPSPQALIKGVTESPRRVVARQAPHESQAGFSRIGDRPKMRSPSKSLPSKIDDLKKTRGREVVEISSGPESSSDVESSVDEQTGIASKSREKRLPQSIIENTPKRLRFTQPIQDNPATPHKRSSKSKIETSDSRPLTDDYLLRKSAIISFSADGPRNRGVLLPRGEKRVDVSKVEDTAANDQQDNKMKRKRKGEDAIDQKPGSNQKRSRLLFVESSTPQYSLYGMDHSSTPPSIVPEMASSQFSRVNENGSPLPSFGVSRQTDKLNINLTDQLQDNSQLASSVAQSAHLGVSLDPAVTRKSRSHLPGAVPPFSQRRLPSLLGVNRMIFASNRKQCPSSPNAPSKFFQDVTQHEEQADGKYVNSQTKNILEVSKPADPFVDRRIGSSGDFIQRLRAAEFTNHSELPTAVTKQPSRSRASRAAEDLEKTLVENDRELVLEQDSPSSLQSESISTRKASRLSKPTATPPDPDSFEEWQDALRPYQQDTLKIMHDFVNQLVRHLVDKETIVEEIIDNFRWSASNLTEELLKAHEKDHLAFQAQAELTKKALVTAFQGVGSSLKHNMKQARSASVSAIAQRCHDDLKKEQGRIDAFLATFVP